MNEENDKPRGERIIQAVAMPADTNPAGDIFGGWLLSQMDLAGGILTKRRSQGRTVTIAINAMEFHRAVLVGDVLICYGEIIKTGNTSMTVRVEAWVQRGASDREIKVTQGEFTYVAIDDNRRPRPITQPGSDKPS